MKKSLYWLAGALAVLVALAVLMVSLRMASNRQLDLTHLSQRPVSATPSPKSPASTPTPANTSRPTPSSSATPTAPSPRPHEHEFATPPATPMATPMPAGGDPYVDVDAALQKLDWGQLAFDVPERLRVDQTALIHLIVSRTQSGEQLTATLRAEATEPVRVEPAQVQISDKMQAKLVGSAFDIQSITPEEPQLVGRAQPTDWKWEIRPRQAGRQSLHLTLNAIVRYEDSDTFHPVRTFDRVIVVEVESSLYKRWLWPVIGLAVLVIGAAVFYRRRRRPPAASLPQPPDGEETDVFVSYARHDQERVLALVTRLQKLGYKVWIDQRGLDGATLWAQEISKAIRRCKVCVFFASEASFASVNVTREVSLASEQRKPILPLLLEPAEVPSTLSFQLAGIQHIALFHGEAEENFQKILHALDRLGVTRPITTDAR